MGVIFFQRFKKKEISQIKSPELMAPGFGKEGFYSNPAVKVRIFMDSLIRQAFFSSRRPFEQP